MMESEISPETLVTIYTEKCSIPHCHCHENLKCHVGTMEILTSVTFSQVLTDNSKGRGEV
jgi:hypothetical protein